MAGTGVYGLGMSSACGRCDGLVVLALDIGDDGSTVRQSRCLCCGWYSAGALVRVGRSRPVRVQRDTERFGQYVPVRRVRLREYRRANRRADPQRVA